MGIKSSQNVRSETIIFSDCAGLCAFKRKVAFFFTLKSMIFMNLIELATFQKKARQNPISSSSEDASCGNQQFEL